MPVYDGHTLVSALTIATQHAVSENVTWRECSDKGGGSGESSAVGFICCFIAMLGFGSNYVPVKKFDCSDGVFFQWVFCCFIWFTGVIIQLTQGEATLFFSLPMIGGALWATGNICVVPIIRTIGMSLGLLLWSCTNLLLGWASGRFGFFGICPEVPSHQALNYVGVGLAIIATILFAFIKPKMHHTHHHTNHPNNAHVNEETGLLADQPPIVPMDEKPEDEFWLDKLPQKSKLIFGIVFSLLSGCLYSMNFAPTIIIQDHYVINNQTALQSGLPYVFSQYTGILFASTVYLVVYCAVMKNKPRINPEIILPAAASAIMWSAACTSWFVANQKLSEAISFPLISTGPGIVGSFWGIFVFKEIRGIRNYVILGVAVVIMITSATLTALSRYNLLTILLYMSISDTKFVWTDGPLWFSVWQEVYFWCPALFTTFDGIIPALMRVNGTDAEDDDDDPNILSRGENEPLLSSTNDTVSTSTPNDIRFAIARLSFSLKCQGFLTFPGLQTFAPVCPLGQTVLDHLNAYSLFVAKVQGVVKKEGVSEGIEDELTRLWIAWTEFSGERGNDEFPGQSSDQWRLLGFQSDKPERDLRSAGLVGLQTMTNLLTKNDSFARETVDKCDQTLTGISFALSSLLVSNFCIRALTDGSLLVSAFDFLNRRDASVFKDEDEEQRNQWFSEVCVSTLIDFVHDWSIHISIELETGRVKRLGPPGSPLMVNVTKWFEEWSHERERNLFRSLHTSKSSFEPRCLLASPVRA